MFLPLSLRQQAFLIQVDSPGQALSKFRSENRTNQPKGCPSNDLYQTKPAKVNQFVPVSEQRTKILYCWLLFYPLKRVEQANLGT